MIRKIVTAFALMLLAAFTLPADFSYQQTSTITGGMMASLMKVAGVFSKSATEPKGGLADEPASARMCGHRFPSRDGDRFTAIVCRIAGSSRARRREE